MKTAEELLKEGDKAFSLSETMYWFADNWPAIREHLRTVSAQHCEHEYITTLVRHDHSGGGFMAVCRKCGKAPSPVSAE